MTVDLNFEGIKNLILDMDGVLWRDSEPIGDLPDIFNRIKDLGLKVVLATNNATRSIPQYQEKLLKLGLDLEPWQIATSGQATVFYLKHKYPSGARIHVMGEPGLISTLSDAGFEICDSDVKAVVVGIDRAVSYKKIETASTLIRNGAEFIGTNPDKTFPTPHGIIPGAGSIIAAVSAAAEIEPTFMGKPNKYLIEIALERTGGTIENTLMIGDRLDTDILAAQRVGCRCCLVLSGVTNIEQAKIWQPVPDFIAPTLSEFIG